MISSHQADIVADSGLQPTDLGFTDFVNRLKPRYQQVAKHLGIVCRIDINQPGFPKNWAKAEKTIDSMFREITVIADLIGVSIKSRENAGEYFIQINAHVHSRLLNRPEGISPSIIVEAELKGISIRTNYWTNTKLSYDLSL